MDASNHAHKFFKGQWQSGMPPAAAAQASTPLSQADRDRIERNRLAALECRKKRTGLAPVSAGALASWQPQQLYAAGPIPQQGWNNSNVSSQRAPWDRSSTAWHGTASGGPTFHQPPHPPTASYGPSQPANNYNRPLSTTPHSGYAFQGPPQAAPGCWNNYTADTNKFTKPPTAVSWAPQGTLNSGNFYCAPPAPAPQAQAAASNAAALAPPAARPPSAVPQWPPHSRPFFTTGRQPAGPMKKISLSSDNPAVDGGNGPMKKTSLGNKAYGPGTTVTVTPAPPNQQAKKLTQSTLAQTMKRFRSHKADGPSPPKEFEADPPEGGAVHDGGSFRTGAGAAAAPQEKENSYASRAAKPPAATPLSSSRSGLRHSFTPLGYASFTPQPSLAANGSLASRPPYAMRGCGIPKASSPRLLTSSRTTGSYQVSTVPASKGTALAARALSPHQKQRARALLCGPEDSSDAAATQQRWSWLKDRRDAALRSPEDPGFDPRTLHISQQEFAKLRGFSAQYWGIKKEAMDLVLFVRVGSFYELYDTDADVGLRIGLNPMGTGREANMWKVGCNAGSFNQWAGKVLALGRSVGRVEECKGGAAGAQQQQQRGGSKLVERRLIQMYTPGTATALEAGDDVSGAGPLPCMALFEGANGLLGACVVDVPSATLAVAQWQESDAARSTLCTLLTQCNPAEVVLLGPGQLFLSQDTRKALKHHRPMVSDGMERPLDVSFLRKGAADLVAPDGALRQDPDCDGDVPSLLQRLEASYFAQAGNEAAFQGAAASLCEMPHAAAAMQVALAHLEASGVSSSVLPNAVITSLSSFTPEGARSTGHMLLDSTSIRSLELVEGGLGGIQGSLLSFLSAGAATAAGHRCIRRWLCAPLYRIGDVNERLDATSTFMQMPEAMGAFQQSLAQAPDCERLLPKVATLLSSVASAVQPFDEDNGEDWGDEGVAEEIITNPEAAQDAAAARFQPAVVLFKGVSIMLEALMQLQRAVSQMRPTGAPGLPPLERALSHGAQVAAALSQLQRVFHPPSFTPVSGVANKDANRDVRLEPGMSAEYDAAVAEIAAARETLEHLLEEERIKLQRGFPLAPMAAALRKVKLVAGPGGESLLEVPMPLKPRLSVEHAVLKETKTLVRVRLAALTAAGERLEAAKSTSRAAVLRFLVDSADAFLSVYPSFVGLCSSMATLDALASFAETTHPQAAPSGCSFCRPTFAADASSAAHPAPLNLHGLWNPQLLLAEATATSSHGYPSRRRRNAATVRIQPKDLFLGGPNRRCATLLLTGANTGGKSTLLRSACLAVIMAQVGCFVPCSAAELAPVDRVFTRMGAQDRIAAGESTFCVEMTETAAVLRHALPSSLVVLDELGRGTSTHDGHAIAAAVARWLSQVPRCRLLFATHYHGLNSDAGLLAAGVMLGHMTSTVEGNQMLVPSFRLCQGGAPHGSCGIDVAAATGLPARLVARAQQAAAALEAQHGGEGDSSGGAEMLGAEELEALRREAVKMLRSMRCAKGAAMVKDGVSAVRESVLQALAQK